MPAVRAILRAPHAISLALIRFLRTALIAGCAALALALVIVRFVVFPQAESYRETLASTLTRELGHPVEIAALTTGWDGWNPKFVIDGLRVLDPARAGPTPLLELPRAELIVAWTSLAFMDLRLKELIVERPRLAIRRDRSGILRVAGIEIDPAQVSDENALSDWLLRQREIVIRDALITWDDDLRNAPQLVLDRVQFRLESRFGRHRFGLKGTPPSELAAPLDLRGDLRFASMKDWQNADGSVYIRLDYADVAAWREWLPLPGQIASGKGALRIWFQFQNGEPTDVTADLELADVRARVVSDRPELDLAHLSGRVSWRSSSSQREVSTRALSFATLDGQVLQPTNMQLTMRDRSGERPPSGQLEFDQLQLRPIVALSSHLPLPNRVLDDLSRFAPRGTLTRGQVRWEGEIDAPNSYVASGEFADLAFVAQDAFPGVTGLSGRFSASSIDGELRVNGNNAIVDLPRVMQTPINLNTLQGVVKWERREGKTIVRVEQFEFANADAAGGASGTYRTTGNGPGEIDLVAHVSRADGRQAYKYLPRGVDPAIRHWLQRGIARGNGTDARLKLAGNLSDFPFVGGKAGQFIVTTKASAVTLDYAEGWPPIDVIDADVRFEGARMTIDATRGQALGVDIGKTRVEIADLGAAVPLLTIDGTAAGPIGGFLRYVNESPVATRVGNITREMEASGSGRLGVKIALPLPQPDQTKVVGELAIVDGQMRLAGVPALNRISGKLAFSDKEIRAPDVMVEVLGGPAKVAITSAEGRTRLSGGGTLSLASVRRELNNSYLDRVSGVADWTLSANLSSPSSWVIESTMKGAVVDLPAPLGKAAAETMPLRIERRDETGGAEGDFIVATYGRMARFAAHRTPASSGANVDRALLSLGKAVERADALRADRSGLWVRAELPALDVDEWVVALKGGSGSTTEALRPSQGLAVAGAEFDVGQLDAVGVRFTDIKLKMRAEQDDWALDLDGRDIAGTATWSMPNASTPNGRIVARLTRFAAPGRRGGSPTQESEAKDATSDPKALAPSENPWPEIDLSAESLLSKDRNLGRLEFLAKPRGVDWRIDRLVLASDSGRLEASGAWRAATRHPHTKLDVKLDVKEAGAFLARLGYPDALQGAPTQIDGQLSWSGAPHEFDFATLAGDFRIDVGAGRFTKIEPGPGKLLGVLSLQALPRRVTLDFRDIFSEGFAFDHISGNAKIASGTMTTSNLKLVGPAAKVDISGETDLARETQKLTVRVQPALASSVSAGAALLFIANPLIGAVVGAGSLLAQTVMNNPIEQMFSYEYRVSGSWSDPVVTKGQVQKAGETSTASAVPGSAGSR